MSVGQVASDTPEPARPPAPARREGVPCCPGNRHGEVAGGAAPPGRPGPAPLRSACAPLSRSLSPLCSFLRLLQLFFSQSSGPQLCLPGLLRSLLVRYRWCPGRGGARPAARRPAAPAGRRPQLPVARHGTGPRAQAQGRDGLAGGDRAEDAVRLGATLLTAVTSLTRSPRRPPPSLSPPSPPRSLRALPLVAAESRVAAPRVTEGSHRRTPPGGPWRQGDWVSAGPDCLALRCQSQSPSLAAASVPSATVIVPCPPGLLGPQPSWPSPVSSLVWGPGSQALAPRGLAPGAPSACRLGQLSDHWAGDTRAPGLQGVGPTRVVVIRT